jgi:hypothetical protein
MSIYSAEWLAFQIINFCESLSDIRDFNRIHPSTDRKIYIEVELLEDHRNSKWGFSIKFTNSIFHDCYIFNNNMLFPSSNGLSFPYLQDELYFFKDYLFSLYNTYRCYNDYK